MLNIFKSKSRNKNEMKVLLASLYSIMLTDDKVSEEERSYFRNLWQEKGFTQKEISDVIGNNSKLSQSVPTDRRKQEAFFSDLVSLVMVDGAVTPAELSHLEKYAKMMGLSDTNDKIHAMNDGIIKQKKGST